MIALLVVCSMTSGVFSQRDSQGRAAAMTDREELNDGVLYCLMGMGSMIGGEGIDDKYLHQAT